MSAFRVLLAWCAYAAAHNPALDISQFAHTAWTVRDEFSPGNTYGMTQTPSAYTTAQRSSWLSQKFAWRA